MAPTDKHKNRQTWRLYDWIGPEGPISEKKIEEKVSCVTCYVSLEILPHAFLHSMKNPPLGLQFCHGKSCTDVVLDWGPVKKQDYRRYRNKSDLILAQTCLESFFELWCIEMYRKPSVEGSPNSLVVFVLDTELFLPWCCFDQSLVSALKYVTFLNVNSKIWQIGF